MRLDTFVSEKTVFLQILSFVLKKWSELQPQKAHYRLKYTFSLINSDLPFKEDTILLPLT